MPIAIGTAKVVAAAKESTFGVAPAAGTGKIIRRVSSNLELSKATYKSNENRPDRQRADFRHGVRSVAGTVAAELAPGAQTDFFASILRQGWQTAATSGAQTTITASATAPHFVRSAGSFITDGFKVGDVVRWSGWAAPATANNANNFMITALTATQMTVVALNSSAVVARAAGDSVTCTVAGKKTWIPSSGHTLDSYTIEHFFSDISQSELFTGCRVSQLDVKLPANGIATADIQFMGKDVTTAQAQYFSSPATPTTGSAVVGANGDVLVSGVPVATITGLNITINTNASKGECVGATTTPDIFLGPIDVTGQATMYFQDNTVRDMFLNETEASICFALTSNNNPNSDFVAFTLPRVKFGGAGKNDDEKGVVLTLPFTALRNLNGGTGQNSLDTTISVQDSLAS